MHKLLISKRMALCIDLVAMVTLLALTGCNTTPIAKYQRPAIELPPANSVSGVDDQSIMAWWKLFKDPVLDALMQEAADKSQDLVLASARIDEARATLNLNQVNFYPTVDLNAGLARRGSSNNSASARPGIPTSSTDLQYGFVAGYEIDFWGKYARADDVARARLLGQTASRGTVLVSLYANVAQAYFGLRAVDAQMALSEKTLATRQENLRLQQRRVEGGVSGALDLRQAEAEAASIQSQLGLSLQNRRILESALALLLGRKPADIRQPVVARGTDLTSLYAQALMPSNMPSDLLNRRPDLAAAEQALIASNADIALARTAYYPRLSLSASLGQQSKELSNLFSPSSLFWNMVGNLAQPIFRAGAVDATVAAATAREKQAIAQYTQAVQSAFKDVHDAMSNFDASRDIVVVNQKRIDALQSSLRLSDLRYKGGYSSYLEVLTAQRDLAQAQIGLIDTQRAQLNALVALYRAVGGGWGGI
jgi:outer membrane protein, multidrug efflux system